MEHFIASFNALMEHTAHVEQQLHLDQEAADVETAEEFLGRHMQIHDQLKKAPQNTIREGNELLRDLEQVSMACALRDSKFCYPTVCVHVSVGRWIEISNQVSAMHDVCA